MTRVYNDNIQTTLKINGDPWFIIEASVERSRPKTPDFVDMVITPDPNETIDKLPQPIHKLIGSSFTLDVDNELYSARDTDSSEVTRLFTGSLANISPTGQNTFEAIAYNEAHQPLDVALDGQGGSLINQTMELPIPKEPFELLPPGQRTVSGTRLVRASRVLEKIVEELELDDVDIQLQSGGVDKIDDGKTRADDRLIEFKERKIRISDALERVKKLTNSEYWFDRYGTFHFGVPEPTGHKLRFITDASAGKTTPPYRSVIVLGEGVASEDGYSRSAMNPEEAIVVKAKVAEGTDDEGDVSYTAITVDSETDLPEPTFTYRSAEISADQEAELVAENICSDLGEQYADGKVTVVGFPEISPLDPIIMPPHETEDGELVGGKMGNAKYGVYKVVHKINGEDGFLTDIHVSGLGDIPRSADATQGDACETASDCGDGSVCVDGVCVPESGTDYSVPCDNDADCGANEVCVDGECIHMGYGRTTLETKYDEPQPGIGLDDDSPF